jgi:hypothetical protein
MVSVIPAMDRLRRRLALWRETLASGQEVLVIGERRCLSADRVGPAKCVGSVSARTSRSSQIAPKRWRSSRPSPPARCRRARDPRPERPGARALSLGQVQRQRRMEGDRLPGAQPAALDHRDRAARSHRARRAHPAPPAACDPRPTDPQRAPVDAAPPRSLALATRLHPRARTHPIAARCRLTGPAALDHQPSARADLGAAGRCAKTAGRPRQSVNEPRRRPHRDEHRSLHRHRARRAAITSHHEPAGGSRLRSARRGLGGGVLAVECGLLQTVTGAPQRQLGTTGTLVHDELVTEFLDDVALLRPERRAARRRGRHRRAQSRRRARRARRLCGARSRAPRGIVMHPSGRRLEVAQQPADRLGLTRVVPVEDVTLAEGRPCRGARREYERVVLERLAVAELHRLRGDVAEMSGAWMKAAPASRLASARGSDAGGRGRRARPPRAGDIRSRGRGRRG